MAAPNSVIGFIGLGQMGVPMLRNLLRAGHAVRGFDINAQAAQAFAGEANFYAAESVSELAKDCNCVILMLPDSPIVDNLLWGDGSNFAAQLRRDSLLIDMGSSDPVNTRENFTRLAKLGVHLVDAPVSGGVRRAVDASLSIMIGGTTPAVTRALTFLQAMGKTLTHVGEAGAGHAVKALNNYVSAAGLLAVSEALVAAEKFGIDPKLVNQVLNTSTGKNNTTEHKVENYMLSGSFNSGFALALMRKDLNTARGFIERMQSPDGFVKVCFETWLRAEQTLDKGADHTALYEFIRHSK